MSVDCEQIRRDAELMLRPHERGCKCDFCALPKLREWILKLARHCLALLADLEQAEREHDGAAFLKNCAEAALLKAEARLAKVPALVEALHDIRTAESFEFEDYARRRTRAALAAWENE